MKMNVEDYKIDKVDNTFTVYNSELSNDSSAGEYHKVVCSIEINKNSTTVMYHSLMKNGKLIGRNYKVGSSKYSNETIINELLKIIIDDIELN